MLVIKLLRWIFTAIAGGVFLSNAINHFNEFSIFYWIILIWGIFWIITGFYEEILHPLDNKNRVFQYFINNKLLSVFILLSFVSGLFATNIIIGTWFEFNLTCKLALGIPISLLCILFIILSAIRVKSIKYDKA